MILKRIRTWLNSAPLPIGENGPAPDGRPPEPPPAPPAPPRCAVESMLTRPLPECPPPAHGRGHVEATVAGFHAGWNAALEAAGLWLVEQEGLNWFERGDDFDEAAEAMKASLRREAQ